MKNESIIKELQEVERQLRQLAHYQEQQATIDTVKTQLLKTQLLRLADNLRLLTPEISGRLSEPVSQETIQDQSPNQESIEELSNSLLQLGEAWAKAATPLITAIAISLKQLNDYRLEVAGGNGPPAPENSACCETYKVTHKHDPQCKFYPRSRTIK